MVRSFSSKRTVPVFEPADMLTTVPIGSPAFLVTPRILNSEVVLSE